MKKLPISPKILLLCLIMYMLLVLPVFADGSSRSPYPTNYNNAYSAEYPVHYPQPNEIFIEQHPAIHGDSCEFCGMYPPPRDRRTAPMRSLNNYRGKSSNQASYAGAGQNYYQDRTYSNYNNPVQYAREVEERSGGVRLQYDALDAPTNMYTNGKPVQDPALVFLPPLYPNAVPKPPRRQARRTPKRQNVATQHVQVQNIQVQNVQVQYVGTPPATLPDKKDTEYNGNRPSPTNIITNIPSPRESQSPSPNPSPKPAASSPPAAKPPTSPATSAAPTTPPKATSVAPIPPSLDGLTPKNPPVAAPYEGSATSVGTVGVNKVEKIEN